MNFREFLEQSFYHQTSVEAAKRIIKLGFSLKDASQKIIWFTNDLKSLKDNTTGAGQSGAIIEVTVDMKHPAGWQEYDKLMLDQIAQNYDGVILDNKNGTKNGFVFSPKQIHPIRIVDISDLN